MERLNPQRNREKLGGSDSYSERDSLANNSQPEVREQDPHEKERKRQEALERNKKTAGQLNTLMRFTNPETKSKLQDAHGGLGQERKKMEDLSNKYRIQQGGQEVTGAETISSPEDSVSIQAEITDLEESIKKLDSPE